MRRAAEEEVRSLNEVLRQMRVEKTELESKVRQSAPRAWRAAAATASALIPRPRHPRLRAQLRLTEGMTYNECCVCLDAAVNAVWRPCMHACLCYSCATRVRFCPLCRAEKGRFVLPAVRPCPARPRSTRARVSCVVIAAWRRSSWESRRHRGRARGAGARRQVGVLA